MNDKQRKILQAGAVLGIVVIVLLTVYTVGAISPNPDIDSIMTPSKIDSRIGTLDFKNGFPTDATAEKIYDNLDFMRGVEAFLQFNQAASTQALREGFESIGARNGSVVLFQDLMDSNSLFLTANTDTVYAVGFLDLKNGPMVIEAPPNLLGLLDDMWFRYIIDIGRAGPDEGRGGKYLILPPNYVGDIPNGYFTTMSQTYGVLVLLRGYLKNGNPAPTAENIRQNLRIYTLAEANNPPPTHFIEASGDVMNTVFASDFNFYRQVNEVVQSEPGESLDPEMLGLLASIGIEKGKPFKPTPRMHRILEEAAAVGNAMARTIAFRPRDNAVYLYPGESNWTMGWVGDSYEFLSENGARQLDTRTRFFYVATGITPAMTTKIVGVGSQYAINDVDADGNYLDGSQNYKLTLPPDIPAEDFWSVTVYDPQSRSMLQTSQPLPSVSSQRGDVVHTADGSTEIHFGPGPNDDNKKNWIETDAKKGFFVILRLYGPKESWFDKTWRPGELELE